MSPREVGLLCWLMWVENPPAMQETGAQSRGRKDPLEKGMATHSSILAWGIPQTGEAGRAQGGGGGGQTLEGSCPDSTARSPPGRSTPNSRISGALSLSSTCLGPRGGSRWSVKDFFCCEHCSVKAPPWSKSLTGPVWEVGTQDIWGVGGWWGRGQSRKQGGSEGGKEELAKGQGSSVGTACVLDGRAQPSPNPMQQASTKATCEAGG